MGSSPDDTMIPIRFQGCKMGIFGLKSWDPPRQLIQPPPVLSPYILSEQAGIPMSSKGILDAHQHNGNMYQAYPTSAMLQNAGMAMMEKNPIWLERALAKQLPYERPNPSVSLERMPEAYVSSGWPVSVQRQTPVNIGPQLPLQPGSSLGADLHMDAADLVRLGRGSGSVLSNGGNWSLGSVGPGSGPNATGSVFQNAVNEGAVNAAGLATHGSQSVTHRGFQNEYQVGDGRGGFSRPEGARVVLEPAPAAASTFRTSQEPKIRWTGEQRPEASDDHKSSRGPNPTPAVSVQRADPVVANPAGQQLIAKHNYDANPDSPLGAGRELSIRRMDRLVKISSHPHHDAWWLARNQKGDEGYIPATYVMVVEEKVGLPWLQNRAPEEEAPVAKPAVKPYRSAYDKGASNVSASSQYKCDPCGKSFNGPQPYHMHMSSRAHREVLETMS